ncbi:hypothetical protein [Aliiruegeria sabulilitoris]|uniref:hypothetical protein n=1 Tax=Aliiruegeria sabulilitoris TaxID=1510458 RepID=UPI000830C0F0|nr:hypothetical protein [Aliiruegeria sabulilitoris]NDR58996.1 hypothetical protein [Pseudoruegeria sp. M32A2M]
MASDLIKELEEREVYISPAMKADILQAERLSNGVIALLDGCGRVMTVLSSMLKTMVPGNAEAGKG